MLHAADCSGPYPSQLLAMSAPVAALVNSAVEADCAGQRPVLLHGFSACSWF